MLPWKLAVGIALGVVLVKESEAVSKFYESVREKATDHLRTWLPRRELPCDEEAAADPAAAGGDAH